MNTEAVETRPIFICGVGRSGTSLVQSMFAAHSCFAFPPETSFLRRLVASGAITRALNHGGESKCIQLLDTDERFKRVGLQITKLLEHARSEGTITGGTLYRSFLHMYAEHRKQASYGDKDPRAIEYLELVSRILPGVQIIHVIRDPRDVLSSKKKAAWSKSRGSLFHIFANYVQMEIGRNEGPALLGKNYHEIIYEDLIAQPEVVLLDVCQKMGLDFEVGMLDFGDTAKRLVSDSELSWKKETLGPILKENHSKWKQNLSGWEVALTELVCVGAFESGGYEKSGCIKDLSLKMRVGVYIAGIGMRVLAPIYRLYRKRSMLRAVNYA